MLIRIKHGVATLVHPDYRDRHSYTSCHPCGDVLPLDTPGLYDVKAVECSKSRAGAVELRQLALSGCWIVQAARYEAYIATICPTAVRRLKMVQGKWYKPVVKKWKGEKK